MKPVKINEIIKLIDVEFNDFKVFINKKNGEIVFIDNNFSNRETSTIDNSSYEELPNIELVNNYNLMENFSYNIKKHDICNSLLRTIYEKKPYKDFMKLILKYGIEVKWREYKENEYSKIVIKWCNEKNLDFTK